MDSIGTINSNGEMAEAANAGIPAPNLADQDGGKRGQSATPLRADEPQLDFLPLSSIRPDPRQPRKHLGDVAGLGASIKQYGLQNPLIVRRMPDGLYEIIAGHRRFAACKLEGLIKVPCVVRTIEAHDRMALQLVENIQREDLHPVELARGLQRLRDEFAWSQTELAERLGMSTSDVNQTLRILDIPGSLLDKIQTSEKATKSILLEVAKQTDPKLQEELLERVQLGVMPGAVPAR